TRAVEQLACDRARLVVACSAEDAGVLESCFGVSPGDLVLVPNGTFVSRARFVTGAERAANRDRFLARLTEGEPQRGGARRLAAYVASWHEPNIEAGRAILR